MNLRQFKIFKNKDFQFNNLRLHKIKALNSFCHISHSQIMIMIFHFQYNTANMEERLYLVILINFTSLVP